jgi:DNA-3-methyladenine glycosylase
MLNFVTSGPDNPQAVLIRGIDQLFGPGKVTKRLQIDKSFNKQHLLTDQRIWVEDSNQEINYTTHPRVGIDYAGDYWKNVPWRYRIKL